MKVGDITQMDEQHPRRRENTMRFMMDKLLQGRADGRPEQSG